MYGMGAQRLTGLIAKESKPLDYGLIETEFLKRIDYEELRKLRKR
jgi:hypothetical protein